MPRVCATNVDFNENTPWKIQTVASVMPPEHSQPASRYRAPRDCVALQFYVFSFFFFFLLEHFVEVDPPGLLMRPIVIPNGAEMGVVSKGG